MHSFSSTMHASLTLGQLDALLPSIKTDVNKTFKTFTLYANPNLNAVMSVTLDKGFVCREPQPIGTF